MISVLKTAMICTTVIICLWILAGYGENNKR